MVQKQWLNLYLYDIDNLTIYKILYYLSGLVVPIFVIINSLNKFTYYKFEYHKINYINEINGQLLFFITSIISGIISFLISQYILVNIKILFSIFISDNKNIFQFDIDKQILFLVIISILLIFKKTKFLIKKIVLINFLIISLMIWFFPINNILLIDLVPFNIIKSTNINFINVTFLFAIEAAFYLWSYISYSSYLSDWSLPKPYLKEVLPVLNILIFYLFIILYYSILSN